MNKQKQFEALARIEGWKPRDPSVRPDLTSEQVNTYWLNNKGELLRPPNYDSHDALQRVIDSIPVEDEINGTCRYHFHLGRVLKLKGGFGDIHYRNRATPAQKREAILKAKGLWI